MDRRRFVRGNGYLGRAVCAPPVPPEKAAGSLCATLLKNMFFNPLKSSIQNRVPVLQ